WPGRSFRYCAVGEPTPVTSSQPGPVVSVRVVGPQVAGVALARDVEEHARVRPVELVDQRVREADPPVAPILALRDGLEAGEERRGEARPADPVLAVVDACGAVPARSRARRLTGRTAAGSRSTGCR